MADQANASWQQKLSHNIDFQDIALVSFGGAFGGFLQPILARFDPSQQNPDFSNWFLGPVLGIAAAGITVFVLANSNTENKLRLLFFSLLCGLAFPSVLTRAVDSLDAQSQVVEDRAKEIAESSAKGKSFQAANELTKTMAQNPSTVAIEQQSQEKLEISASTVVDNLAAKAVANSSGSSAAIEQLKQIGTTARNAGYDGVALKVTEELKQIEASTGSNAAQKEVATEAADAADAIIGVNPAT